MNLVELMGKFHTDEKCREMLEELRWPNGIACPRCGSIEIRNSYTRNQYDCGSCGHAFSVTSGTMLHDTHLSLRKWMVATYLICESKKGVSANQIKGTINVSYKTAWYLCHRIRNAMAQAREDVEPMDGVIEADETETFIGGKTEGKGRGYKGNKAIVVGVVQRGGDIVLQVAEDRTRKTLHEIVLSATDPQARAIFTDDWPAYNGIGDGDTVHETVNHSQDEYVRGEVHTNTIEGVWSLLKRSIIGSLHHVSVKHLESYLAESEWRFGNRNNTHIFRDTLTQLMQAEHMEYQELVS